MTSATIVVVMFYIVHVASAAKILGIFPTPSFSHQQPFQVVMKALAARGHEVTVISTDPLKEPHANYTDIDLSHSYEFWRAAFDFTSWEEVPPLLAMQGFAGAGAHLCDIQLGSPQMQEFIKRKNNHYDLIVFEMLMYQCYYGLFHVVGSPPVVGILSLGATPYSLNAMGNPNNPAYCPDFMLPYSDHMTFWERAHSAYVNLRLVHFWNSEVMATQESLMRKFFGSAPPSVPEVERNFSLLLYNNHWSLNYPRPLLPNVVELTGLHIKKKPSPLPKDIAAFLDGAKDGVIYFSLGTNVRSSTLTEEKRRAFLNAFAELPQKVLWKWETDTLPGKPDNVMVAKWMPQQDVLAHKNVRLFITQGGLQSMQEAAYHGVPVVGIPFIADQPHNVRKAHVAGIGHEINFKTLTKQTLLQAIRKVLHDPSYKERMSRFSAVFRDEPLPAVDRAVWWLEHVVRHGARHLRSAALDLHWTQLMLLDVALVVVGAILITVSLFLFGVKNLARSWKNISAKRKVA